MGTDSVGGTVYCFHPFISLSVIQLVAPVGKRFKYFLLLPLLYYDRDEAKVQADVAAMREALSKTKYVCAFGYCMRKGRTDFEECLRESDKAMYANKANIKKAILEAGGKLHRKAEDES